MKNYNNYHFERILFIRGHCAETLFDKLHACRRQIIVRDKNEAPADFRAAPQFVGDANFPRGKVFGMYTQTEKALSFTKKRRKDLEVRCLITNACIRRI